MKILDIYNKLNYKNLFMLIIVFGTIFYFIFSYISPSLLFMKTITSGGDTASQYYPAYFLKENLIGNWKVIGWSPGWYAGFPLFQFYFPLAFVVIALLSYIISLQVAFKLITFSAIILFPICAYFCFRYMKFSKNTSLIASILMIPFLFMEANSMWGGNIPSTFAGEFSYGIGIAISFIYFGSLYNGITTGKHMIRNVLLLTSVGFLHVYTLLWVVASSTFFLFLNNRRENFIYWFKVNFLSFLLLGFWIVPLIFYIGYTTAYAQTWNVPLGEIFPLIFYPFYLLTLVSLGFGLYKKDKRILFFGYAIGISTILYYIAESIGGVNIRYVPFIQVLLLLIGASIFEIIFKKYSLKNIYRSIFVIVILIVSLIWVASNVSFIHHWADWNYKGFEDKARWPQFSSVNQYLKGDANDGRVVYEHSPEHNQAGTTRAFESLPLFSGRSTLEGLYMQSSPSSPFVFYIQSEVSKLGSCPFLEWRCTTFNLAKGTEHLKLFNVQHFVAISDQVKNALRNNTEYKLVFENQPYEVYELTTNENNYVTIPEYEPLIFPRYNWRERSYELFKEEYVPVIFNDDVILEDTFTKTTIMRKCNIKSNLINEEITFTTDCIGLPHLIKVSYFPRWKVEGADEIHLVSPSFMLVYPTQENVRLYFGRGWVDNFALILTILGVILVLTNRIWMKKLKMLNL